MNFTYVICLKVKSDNGFAKKRYQVTAANVAEVSAKIRDIGAKLDGGFTVEEIRRVSNRSLK